MRLADLLAWFRREPPTVTCRHCGGEAIYGQACSRCNRISGTL